MIVYKATNLINGKSYVGKTTEDFEKFGRKYSSRVFSAMEENP